jgi:uncharacterized membrane protein YeaQ/YmgE (transglycosylase-associated protein family)
VYLVRSSGLIGSVAGSAHAAVAASSESISTAPSATTFLAGAIGAMIACALSSFFLAGRVSERTHVALAMLIALIGAFCLLTQFGPAGGEDSMLGVLIIAGLIGLFKLMNRFEARTAPGLLRLTKFFWRDGGNFEIARSVIISFPPANSSEDE